MLRIVCTLFLQACLLAASPAFAQDRTGVAEALLRSCGLWVQLAGVEPQVQAGFVQGLSAARPKPSEAETGRLAASIKSAYETSRLRAAAARVVAKGLDEQHVAELQRWYASPAALAITKAEEQGSASRGDSRDVAAKGSAVLEQSDAHRRELLAGIVREGKVAESAVELTVGTAVAIQRGLLAATPDAPSMTAAEIESALAPRRPLLLKAYVRLAMANAALTYEPISDAELERYVDFMQSPAGRHFNELVLKALDAALSEAAEELGRSLPGTKDRANS